MNENSEVQDQHSGPTVGTYVSVGVVLAVITVVEVGVFYVPAFKAILAPVLLTLSAVKFTLVVMFFMHLKNDHRLFAVVFTLPLMIAAAVIVALLFLFGVFALV